MFRKRDMTRHMHSYLTDDELLIQTRPLGRGDLERAKAAISELFCRPDARNQQLLWMQGSFNSDLYDDRDFVCELSQRILQNIQMEPLSLAFMIQGISILSNIHKLSDNKDWLSEYLSDPLQHVELLPLMGALLDTDQKNQIFEDTFQRMLDYEKKVHLSYYEIYEMRNIIPIISGLIPILDEAHLTRLLDAAVQNPNAIVLMHPSEHLKIWTLLGTYASKPQIEKAYTDIMQTSYSELPHVSDGKKLDILTKISPKLSSEQIQATFGLLLNLLKTDNYRSSSISAIKKWYDHFSAEQKQSLIDLLERILLQQASFSELKLITAIIPELANHPHTVNVCVERLFAFNRDKEFTVALLISLTPLVRKDQFKRIIDQAFQVLALQDLHFTHLYTILNAFSDVIENPEVISNLVETAHFQALLNLLPGADSWVLPVACRLFKLLIPNLDPNQQLMLTNTLIECLESIDSIKSIEAILDILLLLFPLLPEPLQTKITTAAFPLLNSINSGETRTAGIKFLLPILLKNSIDEYPEIAERTFEQQLATITIDVQKKIALQAIKVFSP